LPDIVETGTGVCSNETNMGTNPLDPDSDGDNMSDGDEWIADTDPTRGDDFLHFAAIEKPNPLQQDLTLVSGEAAVVVLEVCTNPLACATWQLVDIRNPPMSRTNVVTVNWGLPPEKAIYRARAFRP
jgi:hypothetical protein